MTNNINIVYVTPFVVPRQDCSTWNMTVKGFHVEQTVAEQLRPGNGQGRQ